MKSANLLAAVITTLLACAAPARAQEFLNPVPTQPPLFLEHHHHLPVLVENGPLPFGPPPGGPVRPPFPPAAYGEPPCEGGLPPCEAGLPPCEDGFPPCALEYAYGGNHTSGLLTGPGAIKVDPPGGRPYAIQFAGNGLLSQDSVNTKAIPSGHYSYGFKKGSSAAGGAPHYGQPLPLVSTSSVDLNIVDTRYLVEHYAPGQNPYSVDNQLLINNADGSTRIVNFQQTAADAALFLERLNATTSMQP